VGVTLTICDHPNQFCKSQQPVQFVDQLAELAERCVDRGGLLHVDARVSQQI
jgi:hypothetical protein